MFEARCAIVLGYSLWRYQFFDFREYTPFSSVRFGIWVRFASGSPKVSGSGFGDLDDIDRWYDDGVRRVAALAGASQV